MFTQFIIWLLSEKGRHFVTHYYPLVKNYTRRFVNLGIYERIERARGVVKEITGDLNPESEMESYRAASAENIIVAGASTTQLPERSTYFTNNQHLFPKANSQGTTNECVLYSYENQIKLAMLQVGLTAPQHIINKGLLYRQASYLGADNGTAHGDLVRVTSTQGVPIYNGTEDTGPGYFARLKQDANILNNFTFSLASEAHDPKVSEKWALTFDQLIEMDKTLDSSYDIGVTVLLSPELKFFGQRVPYLTGIPTKPTGAHKLAGIRGSMCADASTGKRGFYVLESAYYDYEKDTTWRFITEDLIGYTSVLVKFEKKMRKPFEQTEPAIVATDFSKYSALASATLTKGQKNDTVAILQQMLIDEGVLVFSGTLGYFGDLTASALSKWLLMRTGKSYSGVLWGPIARGVIKSLL